METLLDHASLWDDDETVGRVELLRIPLHLNLAACKLKTKDYGAAVLSCTKVLEAEGQAENVKALFRRGQAHGLRANWQLARGARTLVLGMHLLAKGVSRAGMCCHLQVSAGLFSTC
eukprot:SAG11_NODE_5805_length_1460_cov_1.194710_2_plen_117_part_00